MTRQCSSLNDIGQHPMLFPDSSRLHSGSNSICGGSIYSGRSSLYASSARSSVSIPYRSGSISGRSHRSRRSSSVSIRLPHVENCLLPEQRATESRMSVISAWQSIRGSVVSLGKNSSNYSSSCAFSPAFCTMHPMSRKVFLFAPCSRHRCCLGCVSLRDAIPLICVAELVIIALFTLVALDLYVTDGKLFYTNELEGQGNLVGLFFLVFMSISLPVIGVTLSAWHYNKKKLYLVHIIWQWTVLELTIYLGYLLFKRVFSAEERDRTHFLLPSAIVLSVIAVFAILVQCWWIFVFVDALFFQDQITERKSSSSVTSKKGTGYPNHFDYDGDSLDTIESRRHSFVVPIVKLRKASEDAERLRSLDTESLPGLRLASVMEGIPEHHEVVDV